MTTLTIEIPEKIEKTLADLIGQLGGRVISSDTVIPKKVNKKAAGLTLKEKEFLKGFDEAIDFVNQHKEGKVRANSIGQLLNEL